MSVDEKLKKYLKTKQNPALALFKIIEDLQRFKEEIRKELKKYVEKEIDLRVKKMKGVEFIDKIVEKITTNILRNIKGEKGDKGDPGEPAPILIKGKDYFTETEIMNIIKTIQRSIKTPQDGRDGKTPIPGTDYMTFKQAMEMLKRAVSKIKIPQPRDGKDPILGEDYFTEKDKKEFVVQITEDIMSSKFIKDLLKNVKDIKDELKKIEKIARQPRIRYGYGGGGGIHTEIPSGTKDGSNTVFTVNHRPQAVIYQGQALEESTGGYSLSSDGLTITLDVAPASGDALWTIW